MQFHVSSSNPATLRTACLVVPVFEKRRLPEIGQSLDQASGGELTRILKKGDIDGKAGQTLMLYQLPGISAERLLLVGCGKQREFSDKTLDQLLPPLAKLLNDLRAADAALALTLLDGDVYARTRRLVDALEAALYRFDACKSKPETPLYPLKKITLLTAGRRETTRAKKAVEHASAIAAGQNLARDLANLPGNICTPSYLAEQARELKKGVRKLRVSVLEEKDMQKLGMGALLSVSRGSRQPAKLIVLEYRGGKASDKPVALVGKGLTFDAGGISIKPAAAMDEMKYDMCGGASVLGTLKACVELQLPLNVVGLIPSSENLPDGDANKPGDIVTSMSGTTIEVLNTDAEGRLILCDALTYAERFEPAAVIDIATLTGACVIALGSHAAGLLANDDRLADELLAAGEASNDRAWRLPLWDDYQKQLDSPFADLANIGGREAGTITAACFLSRFTKKFKWAHLDIAGAAWNSGTDKGATGRPVALLTQFLLKRARQV